MAENMKRAFTTLGCPEWDLDTILARARDYGYDAVDFRGYRGQMEIWRLPEFSGDTPETVRKIADSGLAVSCFGSSARLCAPEGEERRRADEEVRAYARLCRAFGVGQIRVFGGAPGPGSWEEVLDRTAAVLRAWAASAADSGARIAFETHDSWTRSADVRAVLDRADAPGAGVLWDVNHPVRRHGEAPDVTVATLGAHLINTHWKDCTDDPAKPGHDRLCLFGEGVLPLQEMVAALKRAGYGGYWTLEWEKRWHPELAAPEVAFPRFIDVMDRLDRATR
jgi:sugar phosphate isomerase/epimerase